MANKDDYLTEYRQFFENFAQTVNPKDQLPVKLASYKLVNVEVVGGIIDWTSQYLAQKNCPPSLEPTLIKIVIDETRKLCKQQPVACGFNPSDNAYDPLKLMQTVISITCEVCLRYLDNSKLCSLPSPGPTYNVVSTCAAKNRRRCMEDRHIVIHDLSSLFLEQEATPSSYYAIFDGHAGHHAATYSCAHLHQFLAESKHFISNPEQALREAFYKTDALFIDKCKVENLSSGTTALCALIHHKEKMLYIAWVGDSQAILVRQGRYVQCVLPHMPSREDEKKRVEADGGVVLFWDMWRVNGQLSVSRAIGDSDYKPYITAVPDIVEISLNGTEDFLILACDGLWDTVTEDLAAQTVYSTIAENPDDTEVISHRLVQLAKQRGSSDNITVIVVLLRERSKIAAEAAHWANCANLIMDTLDNANTNPFAINNVNSDIILQKEGLLFDLAKQNGGATTNGKRLVDEFNEDDDLGPETDVDAVDDILVSPLAKNHFELDTEQKEEDEKEKATFENEHLTKNDLDKLPVRDETATPPADTVHDTTGLVDNVADSCEDSDDEWNYFKGDTADKENHPPSETDKEVYDIDNEEMSHLNPNAAEFVPFSPKRTESPALQAIRDEPLIARSPKRGAQVDIKVPDLGEFECEIKSRPSQIIDNKESQIIDSNDESESKLTSEAIMVNLLNGKNIEEIEFRPVSTPIKTFKADEFHFGPNSTSFSTPTKFDTSDALSTIAVFGDASSASNLERALDSFLASSEMISKEQDPMSTSFYQNNEDLDPLNPIDLNKVHNLPDDIDKFLNVQEGNSLLNETISDLPEHNPAFIDTPPEEKVQTELIDTVEISEVAKSDMQKSEINTQDFLECDNEVVTSETPLQFPLDTQFSSVPQVLTPESSSIHEENNSVTTQSQSDFQQAVIQAESSVLSHSPVLPQSPVSQQLPISFESQVPLKSPEPLELPTQHSPIFPQSPIYSPVSPQYPVQSPVPPQSPVHSPVPSQSITSLESLDDPQLVDQKSELPIDDLYSVNDKLQSHVSINSASDESVPVADIIEEPLVSLKPEHTDSQDDVLLQSSVSLDESLVCIDESPVVASNVQPEILDLILESDLLVTCPEVESPGEEITSSVKDSPLLASSPLDNKTEDFDFELVQTKTLAGHETLNETTMETESVATADVNSFLERSLLPDVASPLSPNEHDTIIAVSDVTSVQDVVVTSEVLIPEFPVQQEIITTPTEVLVKEVVEKKAVPKSKTGVTTNTTAPKKAITKTVPAPTKTAAKTTTKPTIATAKPTSATTKSTSATIKATSATTKPTSATTKPAAAKAIGLARTSTTPSSSPKPNSKLLARSPLTNGVSKAPVATTLTKTVITNTKTVPSKTAKIPSTRPATAATTAATTKPPISKPAVTATSRPTTLASKTNISPAVKKTTVTSTVTNVKSTLKTTTTTASSPKPRPATALTGAPARSKPAPAKPLTKTPDTEKSIKDAANKQTASRTAAAATTKTVRKIEPKVS